MARAALHPFSAAAALRVTGSVDRRATRGRRARAAAAGRDRHIREIVTLGPSRGLFPPRGRFSGELEDQLVVGPS